MPHKTRHHHHYYYEIEGKGPPLLLIGGYTSDISLWTPIRKKLSNHFQLLMFDNLGAGRSSVPEKDITLEEMAEELLALSEDLVPQKPHILGHSMGGAMVQILLERYPDRVHKAVIAQSFLKIPPASRHMMQAVLRLYEEGVSVRRRAEVVLPWLFGDRFLTNPHSVETFLASFEKTPHPPSLKGLQKQLTALLQFDSSLWYESITKPVLVLAGDEDRVSYLEESKNLSEKISGSFLHIFSGVGHVAPAEAAEEFSQVVINYLL